MSTYVSTYLELGSTEVEFEIDTDDIVSEIEGSIDVESKIEEALIEPDSVVALACGIIDLNMTRLELRTRNNELVRKNEVLTARVKALESEMLTHFPGSSTLTDGVIVETGTNGEEA